ncbi:FecR family protein [Hanstruepera marina]|uniref:FecR family protein n=1 Tax=Hanstruepera marina TaxID=2873265 RepID=UPI001CA6F877|nr:FecR family protein [Hanstruepera marina]
MDKETLIKKWLNHDLTAEEHQAFKKLDDYSSLVKLHDAVNKFKAPDFDSTSVFDTISTEIHKKQKVQTNWVRPFLRVAALLAICFSIYYFTAPTNVRFATTTSEKTNLTLPDASTVTLNAKSTLTYNAKKWEDNRNLDLIGEAFFKVSKGEKFTVQTTQGNITVLGTEFNVNSRENLFKVTCYEGSVKVISDTNTQVLKPGDNFLILDGKFIATEEETFSKPNWLNNESKFNSLPFKFVLEEFERQYNMKIVSKTIDTNVLFTGGFTHNDMELALKSITLPLNIKYSIKNQLIELSRE